VVGKARQAEAVTRSIGRRLAPGDEESPPGGLEPSSA